MASELEQAIGLAPLVLKTFVATVDLAAKLPNPQGTALNSNPTEATGTGITNTVHIGQMNVAVSPGMSPAPGLPFIVGWQERESGLLLPPGAA
ncbi:MAG TPA: hypothetical protein VMY99_04000 [Nevskiaceae bacterium]|nr:hypothetical protein [Nevskiaceae bacterium]